MIRTLFTILINRFSSEKIVTGARSFVCPCPSGLKREKTSGRNSNCIRVVSSEPASKVCSTLEQITIISFSLKLILSFSRCRMQLPFFT